MGKQAGLKKHIASIWPLLWLIFLCLLAWPCPAKASQNEDFIFSVWASPSQVKAGDEVRIEVKVKNPGSAEIPAGQLAVVAAGQTLFKEAVSAILPNETYVHRFAWKASGQGVVQVMARLSGPLSAEARTEIEILPTPVGVADLVLNWVEVPEKGCLDAGPWTAQVAAVNRGQAASPAGQLIFLVNGRPISSARLSSLSPGQQLLVTFTFDKARIGGNTLAVELDKEAAEGDFNNTDNRVIQGFILHECRPDLVPVKVRIKGPVEARRTPLKAEVIIANKGGGEAQQVKVRILINRVEIGSWSMTHLQPGQQRPIHVTWMPPEPGTYRLRVEVDAERGILEADETNNTLQVKFATVEPLPDLSIDRPGLPSNICLEEEPVKIAAIVTNRGRKDSPPLEVALREGYTTLESQQVPPLAPFQSAKVEFFWQPSQAGPYKLYLLVDPENKVREKQKNNNNQVLSVNVRDCRPDLAFIRPHIDPQPGQEPQKKRVSFKILNNGHWPANDFSLALRINGREAARQSGLRLGPGKSQIVSLDWPLEKTGRQNVEVVLDPEGKIDDKNRGNNSFVTQVEIGPP